MPIRSELVGRSRSDRHARTLLFCCAVFLGCGDGPASADRDDSAAAPDADLGDLGEVTAPDWDPGPDEPDEHNEVVEPGEVVEPDQFPTDLTPEDTAQPDTDEVGPADTADADLEPGPDGDALEDTDAVSGDTAPGPADTDASDPPDADDTADAAAPDADTADTDTPDTVDTHIADADTVGADTPDTSASDASQPEVQPSCSPCATGRIRFERRSPNPAVSALGPVELAPLAHHPVGLVGTSGHTLTDADGYFTLPLSAQAGGSGPTNACHVTFAALLPRDPAAPFTSPGLAVLSTDLTTLPHIGSAPFEAERLWAWASTCQPDVPLDLVVRLSEGAGALAAFDTARTVLGALSDHFGPTDTDLAIVWQRGRAWSCGSCYLDARFSGVTHTASGHHFPRAIFLSGTNANPHQFTPSIIAHELGHFALELWSSPPLIGGAHGFDRRVDPVLAWSEGAATLIGQWSLIGHTPIPWRFFAVQQSIQYWVDLEAIGRSPVGDDSNLSLLVPMPRPLDPLDQPLSEGVVAAILWDLLDTNAEHPGELIALGPLLMSLLSDPRLAEVRSGGPDRAATGPDLVDLLDALRCDPTLHELVGPPSTLPAPLSALLLDFPYDDLPLCESNPSP